MIFETLDIIKQQLEEELSLSTKNWSSENKVVLSHLYDSDGQLVLPKNCVAVSLVNVEETHDDSPGKITRMTNGGYNEHSRPPLTLTLSILLTANFEHYDQSLKVLAILMRYFLNNPSLSIRDAPEMPKQLQRLHFKMFSQNLDQAKDIWSFLGGRYLPSVMYNVRGTEVHSEQIFSRSRMADGPERPNSNRLDN